MSICPATEDHSPKNNSVFEREFQSMFDEKKRHLGLDQVKALEKNFELDNKLEPERKVKLAREIGLQPRQVAILFQNRRARWKTKQLERDYDALKSSYDALKLKFDTLRRDNEGLLEEEAKAKLFEDENTKSNLSIKEETTMADSTRIEQTNPPSDNPFLVEYESQDFHYQSFINNNGGDSGYEMSFLAAHSKDRSSDESDSSTILNSPKAVISSRPALSNNQKLAWVSSAKTKEQSLSLDVFNFRNCTSCNWM